MPESLEEPLVVYEEIPHIFMNALSGINTYQTMKVVGMFKRHSLYILIDSGSTHNFLDLAIAKRLGCDMRGMVPLQIFVANYSKLVSSSMCKDFKWLINEDEFQANMMVVALGSCEMILGVQWLSVIQNVADPRRNGRIGKVFELAEPRFRRDMERNFPI